MIWWIASVRDRLREVATFERAARIVATDMDPDKLLRMKSPGYSFNDDIPSSSPSGKMVLIIFGGLVGFFVLVVLIVEFRTTLGL